WQGAQIKIAFQSVQIVQVQYRGPRWRELPKPVTVRRMIDLMAEYFLAFSIKVVKKFLCESWLLVQQENAWIGSRAFSYAHPTLLPAIRKRFEKLPCDPFGATSQIARVDL